MHVMEEKTSSSRNTHDTRKAALPVTRMQRN